MPQTPGVPDHAAPRASVASRVATLARWTEPARIRAAAAAVVALCATLGVTLPLDLPAAADAAITLGAVLLPLLQGEVTRRAVYSPATHAAHLGAVQAGLRQGPR